VTLWQGIEPKT